MKFLVSRVVLVRRHMHFWGSRVVLVPMRTPSPPLLLLTVLVVSDSLWPHGLQHTRLICPPLSPKVCSNTCPLSCWCHPTISSSAASFFGFTSFPASGSFPVSHLFASRGQSTGTSNSASVLPVKIQDWFPLGWLDLCAVQGTLRSLLQLHSSKASFFWHSAFFMVWLSHPHVTTVKTIALTMQTFVSKVMSLLFNKLSMSWGDSTICYCRCFPHIPLLSFFFFRFIHDILHVSTPFSQIRLHKMCAFQTENLFLGEKTLK